MTASEYIDSGAIEACLMGVAHDKERVILATMERMYPEVRKARQAMEEVLEKGSISRGRTAAGSQRRIIAETSIKEEDITELQEELDNSIFSHEITANSAFANQQHPRWHRPALLVVTTLLVVGSFLTYFFYSRFIEYETRYRELVQQQDALVKKQSTLEVGLSQLLTGSMTSVVLQPGPATTDVNATILYSAHTGEMLLQLRQMPGLATGKQYQLWVQTDSGVVDGGLIENHQSNNLVAMHAVTSAKEFFITEEKTGGASQPNLSAIVLSGKL